MNILVTGGTVFASRFTAEYFAKKGHRVFVLNRGTKPQPNGITPIICDRRKLGLQLKAQSFDAVLDINAYTAEDAEALVIALNGVKNYIFVSSSAVYPETLPQPFCENMPCGENSYWGSYGLNKLAAEKYLSEKLPWAYIIRPPYLYGKMNNLYREAFVFECAERELPFYLPPNSEMPLQFFDIEDMCRFMELLLDKQPAQHIFNVGNPAAVTVTEWVRLCYKAAGKTPQLKSAEERYNIRDYFPFRDYAYMLDVTAQSTLMFKTKPLAEGLSEAYEWYAENRSSVLRKGYIEFISENFT